MDTSTKVFVAELVLKWEAHTLECPTKVFACESDMLEFIDDALEKEDVADVLSGSIWLQ